MSQEKSGLATASMVLGIIAVVGAWIPFLNIVSIILGVLAIALGIAPLIKKRGLGKAIAGVVMGVVTVIIVIAMYSSAAEKVNEEASSNGTTGSAQQEGEKTKFAVNEVIAFDDKEVTVTSVERNWNSGNQFITPDSGKEYVKVQVTIKNSSKNQVSYNTFDWNMQDSQGDIQSVAGAAFTVDGALNSGELAAGGTKSGFLVFEVPSGDTGLTLQYNPSFWTDKKLEIAI